MEFAMKILKQLRRYLWGPSKTSPPTYSQKAQPHSNAPVLAAHAKPHSKAQPQPGPQPQPSVAQHCSPTLTTPSGHNAESRRTKTDTAALRPIVFDLGGVVLNWNPIQIIETVFPDLQAPETTDLAREIFKTDTEDSDWLLFDKGLLSSSEVINRLTNRTGKPRAAFEQLIEQTAHHLQPIPQCLEIMRGLKKNGHPLYFLSNMPEAYANFLIETQDFFAIFEDGIFSSSVNLVKPDAAIFKLAAERWEFVTPPIFIDDSKDNTAASESLGWYAIHFTNPANLVNRLANSGESLHVMRAA
jgi:HAD superfamily hydrolase (TIGR01509 family)